jgi:homoserine kinase
MQVTRCQAIASAPAGVGNIGVGFDLLGHAIAGLPIARRCAASKRAKCAWSRCAAQVDVSAIPYDTERNTAGRGVRALA